MPGWIFLKYTEIKTGYLEVLWVCELIHRQQQAMYEGDALQLCQCVVLLGALSAQFAGVSKTH